MAGAGHKTFTRETLLSDDVNAYLMQQTVMVFPSRAARAAALPSPSIGMHTWLTGDGPLPIREVFTGGAWTTPEALGLVVGGRVTTATLFTSGATTSTDYAITGLAITCELQAGRTYRTTTGVLLNSNAAGVRVNVHTRGRASSGGVPVVADPIVASSANPLAATGTAGRTEVNPSGLFRVNASTFYTVQPFLTGGAHSVLATGRGYMEHLIEDAGPAIAGLPTLV